MRRELFKFSEVKNLSFDEDLELFFVLDNSDWMGVHIPEVGRSKYDVMIEQVRTTIMNIHKVASVKSIKIDIAMATFEPDNNITVRNLGSENIQTVFDYIDGIVMGYTGRDYRVPMAYAKDFFLNALYFPARPRKLFFLSQGMPHEPLASAKAYQLHSDMIDGTPPVYGIDYSTTFANYPVDIYGVAVDPVDDPIDTFKRSLAALAIMDNTPGDGIDWGLGIAGDEDVQFLDYEDRDWLYNTLMDLIAIPENVSYYTSADSAEIYDGNEYTPVTMGRTNTEEKAELEKSNIEIIFSVGNEFAKKWVGVDYESFLKVEIFEKEDAVELNVWRGRLVSTSIKKSKIHLVFESVFTSIARYGLRRLYQRLCPYTLYGRGCNVRRSSKALIGTITNIVDLTYTITNGQVDHFFSHGLVRFGKELAFVRSQIGNQLTVTKVNPEIEAEFAASGFVDVKIYPGCDKSKQTCEDKFSNIINFGGYHYMPVKNPFETRLL